MASRKKFLPEDEIQGLERMGSEHLADHLSSLSHEALVKLFVRMLHSYRLAARAANAAAKDLEAPTEETHAQLMRSMAEYMPNQFSLHAGDLEVLYDELVHLHEQLEGMGCPSEALDIIAGRIVSYEQMLQQLKAQAGDQLSLPIRTPVVT
jgi:hypothetical protein